jgi:hypothetical protein
MILADAGVPMLFVQAPAMEELVSILLILTLGIGADTFVHTVASSQDHPGQGFHACGVGQSEGDADGSCSGSMTPPLKAAGQSVIVRRM